MQNKEQDLLNSQIKKSNLSIEDRSKLTLSGVQEVISFNEEQIYLDTSYGKLNIRGENLKMNKLDVVNGDISICGKINSLIYSHSDKPRERDTILRRIFK